MDCASVRRDCLFSPHAIERTLGGPLVIPTLSIPGERRVTGTPSLEQLREIVAHVLGPVTVPNKVWFLERSRLFRGAPPNESRTSRTCSAKPIIRQSRDLSRGRSWKRDLSLEDETRASCTASPKTAEKRRSRCSVAVTFRRTRAVRRDASSHGGPGAEEIGNLLAVGMQLGLTAAQLRAVVFAYPTAASDLPSML